MNKIVLLLVAVLMVCGCSNGTQKPENLIQKSEMVDILYDVALLYAIEGTPRPYNDTIIKIDLNSIFNKYNIDSLRFTQSHRYYINLHKGVYYKMQEDVLSRLEDNLKKIDSLSLSISEKGVMESNRVYSDSLTLGDKELKEVDSIQVLDSLVLPDIKLQEK